jgi:hypothetical protein
LLDSHLFCHVLLCRRGHVFFLAVYSVVVVNGHMTPIICKTSRQHLWQIQCCCCC